MATTEPTVVEGPGAALEPTTSRNNDGQAHELSSYWTLWTHVVANVKKKSRASLGPVFDFNTVEDFWGVYNSLKLPRELGNARVDVIFMRSQLNPEVDALPESEREKQKFNRIQPEWEDANNIAGGEYRLTLSSDPDIAEKQWELTLLSVLGGSFALSEEICGIWLGVGRKQGNTLSLWKRTPDDETRLDSEELVAQAWIGLLKSSGVPMDGELTYTSHQDSLTSSSSVPWVDPGKTIWTKDGALKPQ